MSEMIAHKGKLVPMNLSGATIEERAQAACEILGFVKSSYHDTWVECLEFEGYRTAYIRDDIIYKIEGERVDIEEFVEGSSNDDGSYDYYVYFYNGGASLSEMMGEVITKASKS